MSIIWRAMQRPTYFSVLNMNVRISWKLREVTAKNWIVVLKEAYYNNLKHTLDTAVYMLTIHFYKMFILQMDNKSIRLLQIS